jgi:hypothetical protein
MVSKSYLSGKLDLKKDLHEVLDAVALPPH